MSVIRLINVHQYLITLFFLTLDTFLHTGGIEKFNRCFLLALQQIADESGVYVRAGAMYDTDCDERYFPKKHYKAWKGNRWLCVLQSVIEARKHNVLILGHINLALIGILAKKINPGIRIIQIVHGIDIWQTQTKRKKQILELADEIWAVSEYTRRTMLHNNPFIEPGKLRLFHNTLDPYFRLPTNFEKPVYLCERYGFDKNTKVVLTVTRLASTEKFKGYDAIIALMRELNASLDQPVHYLLCGKTDDSELERINAVSKKHDASDFVTLPSYIKDEELTDHYLLADTFIMPSKKEGFGIVFIEAMACGCKVIAGNKDGSTEALQHGRLGTLVDPDNPAEIRAALQQALADEHHQAEQMQKQVLDTFGFPIFKNRLKEYLGL